MEYHGKFGHPLVLIQNISLMSRIEICYTSYCLATQTVAPTIPGLQSIKHSIIYMDSYPHKTKIYPSNSYYGSNIIILTCRWNQVEDYINYNFLQCHQDADHARSLKRIRQVSGSIHTTFGVSVFYKVQFNPSIALG